VTQHVTDEEVLRWYECERKQRRFTTFTEANDHAWQVEQSQFGEWHGVHAYQCTHCDGFHIGRPSWVAGEASVGASSTPVTTRRRTCG
jgi:hypothetical protein